MRNALLLTLGAAALAGCDFSGGTDAVAPISNLRASNLPAATGPTADLFFEIQDGTGRSYYRSEIQPEASTASFETALSGSVAIPSTTAPMYVAVYDYEGSVLRSQLLARSAAFTVADLAAQTLTLQDAPFLTAGDSEATFTVTRSAAAAE